MSAKKKIAKKKGPGRGGKRPGSGRKPIEGSRRALLSVRVSDEAKAKVEGTAEARRITPGELVQAWAEKL
jgi:hypothetical protein